MKKVLLFFILLSSSLAHAQDQSKLTLEGTIEFYGEIIADTCAPETHHIQRSRRSTATIRAQYDDCALSSNRSTRHLSNIKVSPIIPKIESAEYKNYAFFISEFI